MKVLHVYEQNLYRVDCCYMEEVMKMCLIDPANISVAYHSPWKFKLGTAENGFIVSDITESKRVSVRALCTSSIIKYVKQRLRVHAADEVNRVTSCQRETALDRGQ